MPPEIIIGLIGIAVVILPTVGVWVGGRITNKAAAEKAARLVAEAAATLKSEIEELNVEDRKALRRYFEERIAGLEKDLRECKSMAGALQRRLDRLEGKDVP